jgi:sporulation protein YlmC with PRC-barrel domain
MERTKLSKAISWAFFSATIAVSGAAYSAAGDDAKAQTKERSAQPRDDKARNERQATQQAGDRYWASDLIGRNVQMSGGRDAEIKDIIVNPQNGQISYVVTEIDTDKAKDRLYAVPANMFQLNADRRLTLNVDQNWLAQRKSWTNDKWPAMTDQGYWGDAKDQSARAAAANMHRLSKLVGHNVHNSNGKQVGEIEDVVVNMKAQKVDFVLMSHDPGATKAEKEYAMPLTAFKFPANTADGGDNKQRIELSVADDKIRNMKAFEKADKKRINEPNFMSKFEVKN